MKKIKLLLQKCKTLTKQLVRSKSSTTDEHQRGSTNTSEITWRDITIAVANYHDEKQRQESVFVGSKRKRYVIDSKYLNHPLVNALMEKSSSVDGDNGVSVINCEVVLFDHLLWMLDHSELNINSDSLDELADLYYTN